MASSALCLLTACASEPPPPTRVATSPPEAPRVTPTLDATEAAFAANLNPLIGLPSDDPDVARGRPVAYALELAPAAAQVAGLQAVEWVLEAPPAPSADGSMASEAWPLVAITRRPAAERPPIGPLSPLSALQIELARAFGADRLTAESAPPTLAGRAARAGLALELLSASEPSTAVAAPAEPATGAPRLVFDEQAGAGEPASALTLAHAVDRATVWRADPVIGLWQRFFARGESLQPVTDADTGEALAAANLLLLELDAVSSPEGWSGEGDATLLRDGRAVAARWSRSDQGTLQLSSAEGGALRLRPGNSWLLLVAPQAPYALSP